MNVSMAVICGDGRGTSAMDEETGFYCDMCLLYDYVISDESRAPLEDISTPVMWPHGITTFHTASQPFRAFIVHFSKCHFLVNITRTTGSALM